MMLIMLTLNLKMMNNNNMFNFGGSNISINFNGGNSNGQISKYNIFKKLFIFKYRSSTNDEYN